MMRTDSFLGTGNELGRHAPREFRELMLQLRQERIFRNRMLHKPASALHECYGEDFPDDLTFEFHLHGANASLKVRVSDEEECESDADLQAVAGDTEEEKDGDGKSDGEFKGGGGSFGGGGAGGS